MIENQPSRTAHRVAIRRAVHQLVDQPHVFFDPLALAVIDDEAQAKLQADPRHFETTPLSTYLRAFMAARSRFAEDQLAVAVANGATQYVVLGAGLDTFAYRNPFHDLRVFEVDFPATQRWKRERLAHAGIHSDGVVTFVPIDFTAETLNDRLGAVLDPLSPTFFSWLGVTPYLPAATVLETLRYIAGFPQQSGVVFDYAIDPSQLTAAERTAFDFLAGRVRAAGEPWQGFFDPDRLAGDLKAMGFRTVEDLNGPAINARYFAGRGDDLHVGALARLLWAEV
ncbi:MAG TPA: SAM-dependent methyltransferase [Gemmatimonadales bacterium]|jgi:methyltransferase (TIGR00027 family)|nr:SAM-dependent methyltransferase [Gemmatimonadales bacterium]